MAYDFSELCMNPVRVEGSKNFDTFNFADFKKDMKLFPFVFNRRQLKILNTALFLYLNNVECFKEVNIYSSDMREYVSELQNAMNLRYDFDYILRNNPDDLYCKPFNVD